MTEDRAASPIRDVGFVLQDGDEDDDLDDEEDDDDNLGDEDDDEDEDDEDDEETETWQVRERPLALGSWSLRGPSSLVRGGSEAP